MAESSISDMSAEKGETGTATLWVTLAVAFVGVAASALFVLMWWPSSGEWTEAGTRGDFVGGLIGAGVALASAVLFFGALLLQRQELQLTRLELRESRDISRKQAEELERQTEIAHRSAVMAEFMNLVRLRNDLLADCPGGLYTMSREDQNRMKRASAARDRLRGVNYNLQQLLLDSTFTDSDRERLGRLVDSHTGSQRAESDDA